MAKNKKTEKGVKTVIGTIESVYQHNIKLINVLIRSKAFSFKMDSINISPGNDVMPSFPLREGDTLCVSMYMNIHKSNKGNCVITQYGKVVNIEPYGKNSVVKDLSNNSFFLVEEVKKEEVVVDVVDIESEYKELTPEEPDGEEDISEEKAEANDGEPMPKKEPVIENHKPVAVKREEQITVKKTDSIIRDRVFLVDLENYADEALLTSAAGMPDGAEYHMFYTDRAYLKQISLDIFENKKVTLTSHKSQPGDQELDKQLVSYLGYLLGLTGEEKEIIIVSRDKGYLSTINFWKLRGYNNIKLWTRIA